MLNLEKLCLADFAFFGQNCAKYLTKSFRLTQNALRLTAVKREKFTKVKQSTLKLRL